MKKKRIFALLLSAVISLTPLLAFAAPEDSTEQTEEVTLSEGVSMDNPSLKEPAVNYAESAILMDMDSGRLLYSKNPEERLYPASTTKMMTAILAIENGNMEDVVTASYEALKDITMEDSHMGLLIGEELTFEQLLTGMMVYSANDAANVIAIHIGGSMSGFVDMMNQKAQELGMKNTHFSNACGIHDEEHYTSAEDLAILAKYCMQSEKFREIVKMPIYQIEPTNKYIEKRILVNTNLFLGTSRSTHHYYAPCIGIKTGHTSQAGYCLVSAAEYNDTRFIAVVMKCPDADTRENAYSYIDSRTLFEFGFNNYSERTIVSPGDPVADSKVYEAKDDTRVALTVAEPLNAMLANKTDIETDLVKSISLPDQDIQAPVQKGDVIGKVVYSYNGKQIASADLVAANDVELNYVLHVFHIVLNIVTNPLFYIPAIIIIIIALIARHQKKKRERKKRLQQLKRNKQRNSSSDIDYRTPDRNASRTERQRSESKGSNSRYSNKDNPWDRF